MSISSANAIFTITNSALFPSPQTMQGWSVDDAFDTEPLETAEVQMGVDGFMTSGFVFVPYKMTLSFLGDSPSIAFFTAWDNAQRAAKDTIPADNGVITMKSVGTKYALTKGVLQRFAPISDAKKVLTPRKFGITWQLMTPAPS